MKESGLTCACGLGNFSIFIINGTLACMRLCVPKTRSLLLAIRSRHLQLLLRLDLDSALFTPLFSGPVFVEHLPLSGLLAATPRRHAHFGKSRPSGAATYRITLVKIAILLIMELSPRRGCTFPEFRAWKSVISDSSTKINTFS